MSFNIINASAGSGKTFTLTARYLVIVLNPKHPPDKFRQILAITFTNKAVGELKERIIGSLKGIAAGRPESEKMLEEAMKILGATDTAAIKARAQVVLKKIVHHYGLFQVSTIDKFNHQLVRTFKIDKLLSADFQVSLEEGLYLRRATGEFIDRLENSHPLAQRFLEYAFRKMDEGKSWDFSKEFMNIINLLLDETHYERFKKLSQGKADGFSAMENRLQDRLKMVRKELAAQAAHFFEQVAKRSLAPEDFSSKYCYTFFETIREGKIPSLETTWILNIGTAPLYPKKLEKSHPHKAAALNEWQPEVAAMVESVKKHAYEALFLQNLLANLTPASIINDVYATLDDIKQKENILFISELNKLIAEVVRDYDAPFIYERLGARYRYFFIDEFQDVSALQWTNLIPLIGNALESADGYGHPGELYLVGDAKQAIYRWRGGFPEQFIRLCTRQSEPFQVTASLSSLKSNYRSTDEVINFNNQFFTAAAASLESEAYRALYRDSSCQQGTGKADGRVSIRFLEKKIASERHQDYCEAVYKQVISLKGEGYKEKDICVLVRKKIYAAQVAEYLQGQDPAVSCATSEGLLLSKDPQVGFLVAMLRYLERPESAKMTTLHFEIVYFLLSRETPTVCHEDFPADKASFEHFLRDKHGFEAGKYLGKSLYETHLRLVNGFGLRWDNYLQSYLDAVLAFSQKPHFCGTIFEFLEYWDESPGLSATAPLQDASVQVMTVHKSKGLEFPVVIYPFANGALGDEKNAFLWYDFPEGEAGGGLPHTLVSKGKHTPHYNARLQALYAESNEKTQLDNLNLLYVALTRAGERLYILSDHANATAGSFYGLFHKYAEAHPEVLDK